MINKVAIIKTIGMLMLVMPFIFIQGFIAAHLGFSLNEFSGWVYLIFVLIYLMSAIFLVHYDNQNHKR